MPITSSAKKALRRSDRQRATNVQVRSRMKTAMDAFTQSPSAQTLSEAFSRIDRAVKNNLLHRNTAARRKARLNRVLAGATK